MSQVIGYNGLLFQVFTLLPRFQHLPRRSLTRWWSVGLISFPIGLGVLHFFRNVLGLPLVLATALAAELLLLARFLVNDRWVFERRKPTWAKLWQFHVASAAGSIIWWSVANALPAYLGIHYLIAATIATLSSFLVNMATNFLWVWRGRGTMTPEAAAAIENSNVA